MPLSPETLPRHELVGLDVEVVSASNPDLVGLSGEVVTETTQTLGIEAESTSADCGADRVTVTHVPKADATFEFELPSDDGGAMGTRVVTVEGDQLVARPPRRTEHTGDSKWR